MHMQYNVYRYTSALQGGFSSINGQHNRFVVLPRSGPPRLMEVGKEEGGHQKNEGGGICECG